MPNWIRQAAAIPVFDGKVCMVTSRSGRRWVLPKGQIESTQTPAEAALVEAWEEAGLVGVLDGEAVGSYCYDKFDNEYHVLVYPMTVTEVRDLWPERLVRRRAWVRPDEAIARVEESTLKEIMRAVFEVKIGYLKETSTV